AEVNAQDLRRVDSSAVADLPADQLPSRQSTTRSNKRGRFGTPMVVTSSLSRHRAINSMQYCNLPAASVSSFWSVSRSRAAVRNVSWCEGYVQVARPMAMIERNQRAKDVFKNHHT